jgi:hypothetical protein
VTLRTPGLASADPADEGFLGGLKSGWRAVIASTTAVLTVLGALLPITVVLLLLGWPALLIGRRVRAAQARRHARSGQTPGQRVPLFPTAPSAGPAPSGDTTT